MSSVRRKDYDVEFSSPQGDIRVIVRVNADDAAVAIGIAEERGRAVFGDVFTKFLVTSVN